VCVCVLVLVYRYYNTCRSQQQQWRMICVNFWRAHCIAPQVVHVEPCYLSLKCWVDDHVLLCTREDWYKCVKIFLFVIWMVYKCVILKTALRLLSLSLSTTVLIRKHSKIQRMNTILDSPVLHDVFVNWIDLVYSWALRLLGICCLLWHPTHALIHTHTNTNT